MKVLFAVSNESISEAIIKRYPSEYKELLSYKNVYYFNAILKEIQKDKSYDRIVISEDLEPFVNTNAESIDNFIFEHLDKISDESNDEKETSIILICSERRTKGSAILNKLFSIGIYDALLGNERNITEVCKLINRPRTKKEAKAYYRIDQALYEPSVENVVNEVEIQNILTHFRKLGKNTERYTDSFNNIASQYTDDQLRIIINTLPIKVKAVLEAESPKYQALMSSGSGITSVRGREAAEEIKESGIKSTTIGNAGNVHGKIVIPSNMKKVGQNAGPVSNNSDFGIKTVNPAATNVVKVQRTESVVQAEPEIPVMPNQDILEDTSEEKRGRGRPKKYILNPDKPKGKRGRPKKVSDVTEDTETNNDMSNLLAGISSEPEEEEYTDAVTVPGLDELDDMFDDDMGLPGLEENDTDLPGMSSTDDLLPGLESDDSVLPGMSDADDDLLPGLESDDSVLPGMDDIEDDLLPGLDSSNDELPGMSSEDDLLPGLDSSDDMLPGMDSTEDDLLPGLDSSDDILPGMSSSAEDDLLPGLDNNDINSFNDFNSIEENPLMSSPKEEQYNVVESIKPQVNYSMSNLNSLLTKDKKIVTFVGSTKNGTSFLVNNLALLFAHMGINTAILDMTQNRNAYYIYTDNREERRRIAQQSIEKLENGYADGIQVNKNLTVYTALPGDKSKFDNADAILSTLVQNHSLVLIDCDFDTPPSYFASCQEIYLVQSMDILTIQPLTAFLRDLKNKNALEPEKVRVVINKEVKVRGLETKLIVAGMARYNDPSMTVMKDLFNKDMVDACTIPFDEKVYSKYLETMATCKVSLNGYSNQFLGKLKVLGEMVYPTLNNKKAYNPMESSEGIRSNNIFSNTMSNTLNKMKKNY